MRWIKLISALSLWLFFFALLIIVHLCISAFRLPNRWKIISRCVQGFTRSMRAVLNIKVTMEGAAPQFARGPYVTISRHFGYLDGIVLASLFRIDCPRYEENSAGRKNLADDCYNLVLGRMSQKKLGA